MNVGGAAWNCFPISPRCICPNSAVKELPRNDHSLNITRCTPLLRHDCPVEGCANTAPSVSCARAHAARHASEGNKLVRYSCLDCSLTFASPLYLDRHALALYSASKKARCESCSKLFAAASIARHRRSCNSPDVSCDKCLRKFRPLGLGRHRRTCGVPSVGD